MCGVWAERSHHRPTSSPRQTQHNQPTRSPLSKNTCVRGRLVLSYAQADGRTYHTNALQNKNPLHSLVYLNLHVKSVFAVDKVLLFSFYLFRTSCQTNRVSVRSACLVRTISQSKRVLSVRVSKSCGSCRCAWLSVIQTIPVSQSVSQSLFILKPWPTLRRQVPRFYSVPLS